MFKYVSVVLHLFVSHEEVHAQCESSTMSSQAIEIYIFFLVTNKSAVKM